MKRIIIAAALALAGCSFSPPSTPSTVAQATVLDEKIAIGAELAYKAARLAAETGVDAGLIKGAKADRVADADNRALTAVQAVRAAYRAGNAASYSATAKEAQNAVSAMLAAIKG